MKRIDPRAMRICLYEGSCNSKRFRVFGRRSKPKKHVVLPVCRSSDWCNQLRIIDYHDLWLRFKCDIRKMRETHQYKVPCWDEIGSGKR